MFSYLNYFLLFFFLTLNVQLKSQEGSIVKVSFSKYEKEWKQVEEAENKGLPKSALETVSSIYQKAKKEKNPAQQVKSIIFQIKLEAEYNDEEIVSAVNRLKKEIETSESPVKQLLHSMLGELYWNYYSQNRYKFLNLPKWKEKTRLTFAPGIWKPL